MATTALQQICNLMDSYYVTPEWVSHESHVHWATALTTTDKGQVQNAESLYLYLRDGFRVSLLRDEDCPLLESAIGVWREKEALVRKLHDAYVEGCRHGRRRGMSNPPPNTDFDLWFAEIQLVIAGGQMFEPPVSGGSFMDDRAFLNSYLYQLRRIVLNISWCRCYVAFVPMAVPQRCAEIAEIGRMMTKIFYLENLGKQLDRVEAGTGHDLSTMDDLNTYLRIANEVIDGTWQPLTRNAARQGE